MFQQHTAGLAGSCGAALGAGVKGWKPQHYLRLTRSDELSQLHPVTATRLCERVLISHGYIPQCWPNPVAQRRPA